MKRNFIGLVLYSVSLLICLLVTIVKLSLIILAAVSVAFGLFLATAYSLGYVALYTLSLTSALRFIMNLLPDCSLKCIPCKSCAMYAATRPNCNAETFSTSMHPPRTVYGREIQRYFGRSLPNKFPTQILSASKTLISNLFFYLSTDFRRFSFFLAMLVYSFLGYWMC